MPLAAALRSEHPELDFCLVSGFAGYLTDWLQRGDIDFAVLYDPQASRSLKSKPLLIENLFLIGPPGATLSPVHAIPFERLETERLLLPSPGHGLRAIVERCAKEAKVALKVGIEADSFATLRIPTQSGHRFRFEAGHRSDLMSATIPK